jgi:hypothetical protein
MAPGRGGTEGDGDAKQKVIGAGISWEEMEERGEGGEGRGGVNAVDAGAVGEERDTAVGGVDAAE